MQIKYLKAVFSLILVILLGLFFNAKPKFLLSSAAGSLPPLGRFMDPFHGFWKNAEPLKRITDQQLKLPSILQPVNILYDHEMVPHIFALNNHDLYFAQGYITAHDRLWQMEFQTMAAAGRIAEIIGKKALDYDRLQRRMGMVYGAENSLKTILADPESREIVLAYTAGINAWISSLKPEDLPLEYKLLDYRPEAWTPLKCALLQKSMAATLSGDTDAQGMTANLLKFGKGVISDLFPDYPFIESPVIPIGIPWKSKKHLAATVPGVEPLYPGSGNLYSSLTGNNLPKEHLDGIGSNNWAVDGSKTSDHHAMLSNDPHLTLSLPSIWYQMQLHTPTMNVYGVSLPGAPGIIIGFNEHISWGVTNVGADVLDIYQVSWTGAAHDAYLVDGKKLSSLKRREAIKIRGGETFSDQVTYTKFGPVVYDETFKSKGGQFPDNHAIRWVAYEGSNEVKSLYLLNKAAGYPDFSSALGYFASPAQNFAYADDKGHIAIWVNGRYPVKARDQGKYILDGSSSKNDWKGWIPHDQVPHVLDPPRHFIASANQSSTDTTYPYYLNWQFENTQRAMRINHLLASMNHLTPDSLRRMQTDLYNEYAGLILPDLLKNLRLDNLNPLQQRVAELMKDWNLQNTADAVAPTIFDIWSKYLMTDIWDEFQEPGLKLPSRDRTIHLLLKEPGSIWFDNRHTNATETKADIINASFRRSIDTLKKKYGPQPDHWKWYEVKATSIKHLLNIDAFSHTNLHVGGGSGIVDAITSRTGPSWRMVVKPGVIDQAYGVYPGGQSGNPGSYFYDNLLEYWSAGKLYPLVFMKSESENQDIISRIILRPGK